MSTTAVALLGFAALTLLLVGGIGVLRVGLTLAGRRAANTFSPTGSDVSPFSERLCRAHANCYENLPVAAAVGLVAIATGNAAVTDPLALYFLGARCAQAAVHIASTSVPAVFVRFTFFLIQYLILLWWVISLARIL